jgi:hypothetical protein
MPAWPDEGSVALVDGVVVLKLGAPLPAELAELHGS